jgi:hypothetical protein
MFFNGFHHLSLYWLFLSKLCKLIMTISWSTCILKKGGRTELEESTWKIKIRYISLELYHVNTNIFVILFLCLICMQYLFLPQAQVNQTPPPPFFASCGTQICLFCEILLHKYHIDGKHVRVYQSLICQQTSFLAMANSKYGHWRDGA